MSRTVLRRLFAMICIGFLLQAPAHASNRLSARWSGSSVPVVNNAGPGWEAALNTAIGQWNSASPVKLEMRAGSPNPCAVLAGAISVCEEAGKYLGVAEPHVGSNGRLSSVVVALSPKARANHAAAVGTACHELGHALGLDHQSAGDSCMRSFGGPTSPNSHDFDELRSIYPAPGPAKNCWLNLLCQIRV